MPPDTHMLEASTDTELAGVQDFDEGRFPKDSDSQEIGQPVAGVCQGYEALSFFFHSQESVFSEVQTFSTVASSGLELPGKQEFNSYENFKKCNKEFAMAGLGLKDKVFQKSKASKKKRLAGE